MPFDVDAALESLSAPRAGSAWPAGAPMRDHLRSPAAMRVGQLAVESGLFLFHFEHRTTLEIPDAWIAPGREEDARPPEWVDGVLPESKYQSFRHDLYLGSFHPGHRGKWTAHELCHGLVGTAWRPDASPFFHATAARMAELLPVVLWYFLDEVALRRCPDHAGDGALFRSYCADCEDVAAVGPFDVGDARRRLVDARDFLDRELAAVSRSLRAGRPIPHRWATLDLASDGLAYAAGHGRRLSSPTFRHFAERYPIGFRTLDALEARVVAVARAICEGTPLPPVDTDWVAQDVGWRVLQVAADAEEEVAAALAGLLDHDLEGVIEGYLALHDAYVLPEPELVFAVGYDLPRGFGRSVPQIREGLRTVTPLTLEVIEDLDLPVLERFVMEDRPERRPLGDRFAAWLEVAHPDLADLARYESALRHAGGDPTAGSLGMEGGRWRLARGARAWVAPLDLASLADAVDSGEVRGRVEGTTIGWDGAVPPSEPTGIVVGRDGHGEAVVVQVSADVATALATDAESDVAGDAREVLRETGLWVPTAWPT